MKLTIASIGIALFCLFSIGYSFRRIKRDTIGFWSGITWIALWISVGFFSLFPGLIDVVMRMVQMKNRMFFITLVTLLILLAIVFNLTSRLDNMKRDLIKLARELAITNHRLDTIEPDEKKNQD